MKFTISTPGPLLKKRFPSWEAAQAYVADNIPLLRRRGYTYEWTTGDDGVRRIAIFNSKGTRVRGAGAAVRVGW